MMVFNDINKSLCIAPKEEDGMKKREWEKPKLILLLRGKPEEAILQGCKLESRISGARDYNEACFQPTAIFCDQKCLAFGRT